MISAAATAAGTLYEQAEVRLGRSLFYAELAIDLAEADKDLEQGKLRLRAAIEAEQRRVIEMQLRGLHGRMQVTERMVAALVALHAAGLRHALAEIRRLGHKPRRPFRMYAEPELPQSLRLKLEQGLRTQLGGLDQKILTETSGGYFRKDGTWVDTNEIGTSLGGLGQTAVLQAFNRRVKGAASIAANMTPPAFDAGLADGYEANEHLFTDGWVYTAIMDAATCDVCAAKDGTHYDTLSEGYADLPNFGPNPDCLGGDRCRCRLVPDVPEGGGPFQSTGGPTLPEELPSVELPPVEGLPEIPGSEEEFQRIAVGLRNTAISHEPEVRAALQEVAKLTGGDFKGLEFAIKSQGSLVRKLKDRFEAFHLRNPRAALEDIGPKAGQAVKDSLRYTLIYDPETYTADTARAIRSMDQRFQRVELDNYWQNAEYKGVNGVWRTADGQPFELQFHTPESFDVKDRINHPPYEVFRQKASPYADRSAAWDLMVENSQKIEIPPGATTSTKLGKIAFHEPLERAEILATPFRVGDVVAGFRDTVKNEEFLQDLQTFAARNRVTVDAVRATEGWWQGSSEPSYVILAHDGKTGIARYAEELRAAYQQDAVGAFHLDQAGNEAAYRITNVGARAPELLQKYGFEAATQYQDGSLMLIAPTSDAKRVAGIAGEVNGRVTVQRGTAEFVEAPAKRVADNVSVGDSRPVSDEFIRRINDENLLGYPEPRPGLTDKVLPKGVKDTFDEFVVGKDADGTPIWTPEREQLHETILRDFLKGIRAQRGKRAYFTSGGGASGKSSAIFDVRGTPTSVKLFEKGDVPNVVMINPDLIKEVLPEYQELFRLGDPYAASAVHEESSFLAKELLKRAMDENLDFLYDTTASSAKFNALVERAAKNGYRTDISMVSAPTNRAIERSMIRGDETGRYVSIGALKDAHTGASKQFMLWASDPNVTAWKLYDSSTFPATLVAEKLADGEYQVYDETLLKRVVDKATEEATKQATEQITGIQAPETILGAGAETVTKAQDVRDVLGI